MHSRIKRWIASFVLVPTVGYCAGFTYLIAAQRSFVFLPAPPGPRTPAEYQVPFEAVSIPVGQVGAISAWWMHHDNPAAHPTVVYCHGNGGTLSMYANVARIFHQLGWNALLFDYRGYGTSSPAAELSEQSVAEDAQSAYAWARARVPETQMIIWGHSLGGAIAARLASRNSPTGVVLEGAFPSLLRMARARYPFFPIGEFMLRDSFDTVSYLQNRNFPVLLMHAEHDVIIPPAMGEELFAALAQPKERLTIADVGHNDFPSVHARYDETIKRIVASWIAERAGNNRDAPSRGQAG